MSNLSFTQEKLEIQVILHKVVHTSYDPNTSAEVTKYSF